MDKECCVKLDICKNLKIAGWHKNTEFRWYDISFPKKPNEICLVNGNRLPCSDDFITFKAYPAPIVSEILKELPILTVIVKRASDYKICLEFHTIIFSEKSLPDALAKCWLWLKEKKEIK